MEIALQYLINGLMLGLMYGLVAVGFTLFFGVLDVIKFSHGDVLTVGVFTGFATYLGLKAAQVSSPLLQLIAVSFVAMAAMAALGAVIARTDQDEIMGVRHKTFPLEGVQYHPESFLTQDGTRLLRNFIGR